MKVETELKTAIELWYHFLCTKIFFLQATKAPKFFLPLENLYHSV